MRVALFLDQSMGSKHAQLTRHLARLAFLLLLRRIAREEDRPQVAVAETVDGEFSTADGL